MKIAAIIIACNEESNIARCVRSVRFCDQVLVIDSGSQDRTAEVARANGAEVHSMVWRGYAEQKNAALKLTNADWILSIDADEEVTLELKEEILRRLNAPGVEVAFSLPRKTIHFGRWIRYGGWYPNRIVRLFQPSAGRWVGSEVHEKWEPKGVIGELETDLMHYSFSNLADQVQRNNRYSSLSALEMSKAGKRFSTLRLFLKSLSKFFETYFLKRGFLDGYPGFIISVSAAYSVFLKWAKLWELENGAEKV